MKTLAAILILLPCVFAQTSTTATGNSVHWDGGAPGASQQLQDGRTQKTVKSNSATVAAIADLTSARQFVDPPMDGGNEVSYILIGIQNTSAQPVRIDPGAIMLRVAGKKEQQLKRLREDQVIARAWANNERGGGGNAGVEGMKGANDVALEAAVTSRRTDTTSRRMQEASEQKTVAQTAKLKEKALPTRELEPGESVKGLVFFYPFSSKDTVELSVPVGDTTFVIPFSGSKAKK